jgi:hypothetical protein
VPDALRRVAVAFWNVRPVRHPARVVMVIKHIPSPPPYVRDSVGARQDVLVWGYGVVTGHVVAVQLLAGGGADLVVEFEVPQPEIIDDDLCSRVQACRFDPRCPFVDSCAQHEHGPDCGGCR